MKTRLIDKLAFGLVVAGLIASGTFGYAVAVAQSNQNAKDIADNKLRSLTIEQNVHTIEVTVARTDERVEAVQKSTDKIELMLIQLIKTGTHSD
jgi:hypothetical protein